jgi:glycosyltransferase involved in cell wall biosynthesis
MSSSDAMANNSLHCMEMSANTALYEHPSLDWRGAPAMPSRPLRVLFVNDHLGYERGVTHGGTTYFLATLPKLDRRVVDSGLCILGARHAAAGQLEALGIRPVFFARAKWDLRALGDLVRVVKEQQVDILHLSTMKSALLGAAAAAFTGRSAILHLHDLSPLKPGLRHLHRLAARRMSAIIAVSEPVRRFAEAAFDVPAERIEVIPNGIRLDALTVDPAPARRRLRCQFGLTEDSRVIGMTSRLFPDKGHRCLIRAMPSIIARCPGAVLLIAGDGPTRADCEALVRQLHLEASVRFLGHRNDIPDVLAAIDVFAMPSTFEEGFGYSALEAIASGRPVVAFASEALERIVLSGRTGMLVANGDIEGLATRVATLLVDRDLARRLGAAGRCHAETFHIERHTRRLEDLYMSFAARANVAA